MEKTDWTSTDIRKLFRMDERFKSHQTLLNAEKKGDIPQASRKLRGKVSVRNWSLEQIPKIGKKFGYLKPHGCQLIISQYVQKGGVLKTTSTFNEARTFALNGFKTLVIGLDFECSVTDVILPHREYVTLRDTEEEELGLWHYFCHKVSLEEIIQKTSLPTLDIIPETHKLVALDKSMNQRTRKEYSFTKELIPKLSEYDVILFDHGPSWNNLTENALTCSNVIMMPLGCNLLAFKAAQTNIDDILRFQEEMAINNQLVMMFPTLLTRSSLSQQIYAGYLTKFGNDVIPIPIREAVKGQEALLNQQTILEYAPTSALAQDYYELINEMWHRIGQFFGEDNQKNLESLETIEA